jgi:hypothetical protein
MAAHKSFKKNAGKRDVPAKYLSKTIEYRCTEPFYRDGVIYHPGELVTLTDVSPSSSMEKVRELKYQGGLKPEPAGAKKSEPSPKSLPQDKSI